MSVVDLRTFGHHRSFWHCCAVLLLCWLASTIPLGSAIASRSTRDRRYGCQNQTSGRIEIGALRVAQSAMRVDDGAKCNRPAWRI